MSDGAPSAALLTRLARPVRKIAVLRASRLGDFICATPALRALRAAVPDASITMITLPGLRELVARSPHLDRFVAFPGFPGIAQQFFQPHETVSFFQRMQAECFDLAIQLQGSGVYSNPFTRLLGATATAGYARAEDDTSGLDASLAWTEEGLEVTRLLRLIESLGARRQGEATEFRLFQEDRAVAARLIDRLPRPLIGVHAGSHDPRRRWPLGRFATVLRVLLRRYGGTVVVLGALPDSDAALELTSAVGPGAYSLTGRTSLASLGAVIAELDLLVTNDSGPAHIGYALHTPTVTIFRSGGAERYGPPSRGPFVALEPLPSTHQYPSDALVDVTQVLAATEHLLSTVQPTTGRIGGDNLSLENEWNRSAR